MDAPNSVSSCHKRLQTVLWSAAVTIGDSLDGAATGLLLHVALETLSWKISDALRINVDVSIGENVGPLATSWAYRMH